MGEMTAFYFSFLFVVHGGVIYWIKSYLVQGKIEENGK